MLPRLSYITKLIFTFLLFAAVVCILSRYKNSEFSSEPLDAVKFSEPWRSKSPCSSLQEKLNRSTYDSFSLMHSNKWKSIIQPYEPGGHCMPKYCKARHKVAIVVPYKNRVEHLKILIPHLHEILHRQALDYVIFVVEPLEQVTFNRGKLINIGFAEAMKTYDFDCVILHDVDLLPMNDRIPYSCEVSPAHLSRSIDKFYYSLPYLKYVGGVVSFSVEHFRHINGASNRFWGWGGEDDDLFARINYSNLKLHRPLPSVGRYHMLNHTGDAANPENKCRYSLLRKTRRLWKSDGLNNLKYKVESFKKLPMYTHIKVDVLEKRSRFEDGTLKCKIH